MRCMLYMSKGLGANGFLPAIIFLSTVLQPHGGDTAAHTHKYTHAHAQVCAHTGTRTYTQTSTRTHMPITTRTLMTPASSSSLSVLSAPLCGSCGLLMEYPGLRSACNHNARRDPI